MKTCTGCKRELELEAFPFDRRREDARQARCRECQTARTLRRRRAQPEALKMAAQRQQEAELAARGMKRCARKACGQVLPLESFNRNSASSDGRYAYCKQCCVEIDAARRPRQPEPVPSNNYGAVHSRMGSVAGRKCSCGEAAEEWAYDHGDPEQLTDEIGRPYSLDQGHYMAMCRKCHRKYDADFRKATGTARPRKRRLKPCAVCREGFWNPSHHRKTCSAACETALRSRSGRERNKRSGSADLLSGKIARELAALAGLRGAG